MMYIALVKYLISQINIMPPRKSKTADKTTNKETTLPSANNNNTYQFRSEHRDVLISFSSL